jgi:hypothetical protein
VPSQRIQPGFGGMNSEASPEYLPAAQAAVLENLLPRLGKVVLRGPISTGIDLGASSTYHSIDGISVLGAFNAILVSLGTPASFSLREITAGVAGAGTVSTYPGVRCCSIGDLAYSIGLFGNNPLVRWDGSGATVALTNGPNAAEDVTVHLNRLFTIQANNSQLKWSDQGGSPANTAAEWQDDVSGLTNVLTVGDTTDSSCALARVGRQLAILKNNSLYMLTGQTPSSFSVQRASSAWGCIDRESTVEHDDGVYFLSNRGFAFFDGTQVTDCSQDIKAELITAIRTAGLVAASGQATTVAFARAAALGRDSIMLTIGKDTVDAALPPTVTFCGIYDTRARTWSRFSSGAFVAGAPIFFISTPATSTYGGKVLGYDGKDTLMYLNDIASPESISPALGGEDVVDGTTAAIPGLSYSKIMPLSSPSNTSQIKRLLLDYTFVVVSDADPTIEGWSVSLVDGLGNVLLAPTTVQATILASGYTAAQRQASLVRKRFAVEFYGEASEAQLRISLPALDADVTEVIAAEIHDATIEFTPGRDRPTS